MPVYKCPKCGRTVELPEGKYYCKVCGPSAVMILDRSGQSALKKRIIEEIKWLLENDWYSQRYDKVSAVMVYSRIYNVEPSRIDYGSKRWKDFLNVWTEMFKEAYLSVDQWGQPVILHNARSEVGKFERIPNTAEDEAGERFVKEVGGSNPKLSAEELEVCQDFLMRLRETGQIYIVGHDVPISISRGLYIFLDELRKKMAKEKGVPEVQYEWEDLLWDLAHLKLKG
jgi:DNA-directed RNA polymerase subunit RPC12/RpoP